MTVSLAFDAGLAMLVLALAGWTIAARGTFAAVIGFVVYGLLLAVAWVRVGAVDVAMTEVAIGSGVTGALLIRAAARLRPSEAAVEVARPRRALRIAVAMLCACVTATLAAIVLAMPETAPTLAPLAVANLPATGLGNPVTAVLLAYRAIDTLLEKVVLVLALLAVWSLAPDALWGGSPGPARERDPRGPLTFLAQILPPVGIVVGIHLLWVGADHPGGAFQGATVLAAMWLLAMMAGLAAAPPIGGRRVRLVLVVGALVFMAVGLAGIFIAGAFLAYPAAYAKPLILLIEFPVTLSVAATLALLVLGPPQRAGRS